MAIDLHAGQVPTADEFLVLGLNYYRLGTAEDRISTTTLQPSNLIVPINGLTEVRFSARYHSQNGGIRWDWLATGSIVCLGRDILSPGVDATTTLTTHAISSMRLRQIATLDEAQEGPHFTNSSVMHIAERLIVDGVGDLVFRYAQNSSNAASTILHANTYATTQRIV